MAEKAKKLKFISTAYRVLIILVLLNQGKSSIEDLIRKLSTYETVARFLSRDAITKYINTLKFCNYSVLKTTKNNKTYFYLEKSPFNINISRSELEALALMDSYINSLHQPYLIACFNSTITKIQRYLTDKDLKEFNKIKARYKDKQITTFKKLAPQIAAIEKYCLENQTVFLSYSPYEGLVQQDIIMPEIIDYKEDKAYFCGYDPKYKDKKRYQIDKIIEIKPLPHKSYQINYEYTVHFKLTGKLAQIYRLYEGEEIIERKSNPPELIICSQVDDIEMLIGRILRYSHYCEILSPTGIREKVRTTIKDMINYYNN